MAAPSILGGSLLFGPMDLGLRGKSAAVMGASAGIGRAVAERFADEGMDLVVCGRDRGRLEAAAGEITKRTDAKVHAVVADVTDHHALERVFDAADMESGGLDVLVTNHGGPPHGRFADLSDDDWFDAFDLIVLSVVRASRMALPLMRRRGGGSIVHIVSTAARQPIDNLLLSNALRPAVTAFAKATSIEFAKDNVRVNCVLPGLTATGRLRDLASAAAEEAGSTLEEALAERTKTIPLARLGEPTEIADAVVFLSSARASYLTGQSLAVDGGILKSVY